MKRNVYLSILFIFSILLLNSSCRKDDCPVIEEPVIEENPDNPDGHTEDDLIGSVDYLTISAFKNDAQLV